MGHSSISLALILAGLALLAATRAGTSRLDATSRVSLLAVAVLLTFVGHLRIVERRDGDPTPVLARPTVHLHEFVHYFLGTKYFRELGHDDLYEGIVLADFADDAAHFVERDRIRNLSTNRVDRVRADVVREGARIRERFSDARWASFRADVALLRDAYPSLEAWHRSDILKDHGYNGTPLTTALFAQISNQPWLSTYAFLETIRYVDIALVAAMIALVLRGFGAEAGLAFAALWYANPFNDFGFIGGSYLRYDFALCLVAAYAALVRGRLATAGVALALAAHFRIFPAFFAIALALHDALRPGLAAKLAALREHRRLYAAYAATAVAVVALTSLNSSPPGTNTWALFLDRIATQQQSYGLNGVGVASILLPSDDHTKTAMLRLRARGDERDWEQVAADHVASRAPLRAALVVAIAAGVAVAARRLAFAQTIFLGFPMMFAALYLSHYYFMALGLLALVFRHDDRAVLALTAFTGAMLVLSAPPLFADGVARFALLSGVLLAMFGAVGAIAVAGSSRDEAEGSA